MYILQVNTNPDSTQERQSTWYASLVRFFASACDLESSDGLELRTKEWEVAPLAVDHVRSSFFEDERLFPAGSTRFDSAPLMRRVAHEWHTRASLTAE